MLNTPRPSLTHMVKVISPLSQREVEAVEVDFEAVAEPWVTYKLSDGAILKVKIVVTGVVRLEGEHDHVGNPIYSVASTNVIRVTNAPKDLKGAPSVPGTMTPSAKPTTGGPEIR